MKVPLVRTGFAFAVVISLVIMGCSKSPTAPAGNGQGGSTSNGHFTITQPAYGDSVLQGAALSVVWTSSASMADSFVTVSLYKGNDLIIAYGVYGNTGANNIQIPYSGSGSDYRVRISSASDTSKYDMSSYFKVYSGFYGTFTVTSPTSDSAWTRNTYHYILWTSTGSPGPVTIQLYNDTTFVSTIASGLSNSGSYYGLIPAGIGSGNKYRIKISSYNDISLYAYSSSFTVLSGYYGTYMITSPTSDSTWTRGTYNYILWTYAGSPGTAVNIYLYNDTTLVSTIASGVTNSGSYYGLIPAGLTSGNKYRIKVISYYDSGLFAYSSYFAIVSGYTGTYTITSPTVDSTWNRGAYHYVLWTYTGSPGVYVNIYLYDTTSLVSTIASGVSNSGSYNGLFPASLATGNRYRIVISSYYDAAIRDTGDYFSISNVYTGTYTITSPTVDSTWNRGAYHYVLWTSTGSPGAYVNIYLYDTTSLVSTIASGVSNSGSYYGLVPAGVATGNSYRIVIASYYAPTIRDTSDYFTVIPTYYGTYTVTSPTVDSSWTWGNSHYVRWTYTGSPGAYTTVRLYNNTTLVSTLTTTATTSNDYYYASIPTGLASGNRYRIMVLSYYDSTIRATSDSFTIVSPYNGTYTVTSPPLDTTWTMGSSYYVRWTYTGSPGASTTVRLYNNTTLVSTLTTSATTSNDYYYASIPTGLASGNRYRIMVLSYYDSTIRATSDSFTIVSGYNGTYTVTSPTVDSSWTWSTYHYIYWTYTGNPGTYTTVRLYNDTSLVSTLATTATTSNDYYYWYVPTGLASGNRYRIVVSSYYDASIIDTSDYFTVVSPYNGTYTVTSPPLDTTWTMGSYYYVRWTDTGNPGAYTTIRLLNGTSLVSTLVSQATTSTGYYDVYIPTGIASGSQYRIVVSSYYDASIADTSDYFNVVSGYTGTYTITTPTAATSWYDATYYYVYWTYTGNPGAYTTIRLLNGTTLVSTLVTTATTSTGDYDVYIPSGLTSGNQYRIVVSSYYDASITDTSDYFTITSSSAGDAYEPDGSAATAHLITTDGVAQYHTIPAGAGGSAGDYDWMIFSAVSGTTYTMQTNSSLDMYMYLYGTNGSTLITSDDDSGTGNNALITWTCTTSGNYYCVVRSYSATYTGPYSVTITHN